MKRLFLIFALLLVPSLAFAGENIKQKDTGATVWENSSGDQTPVGDSGLTVYLENVSTASTAYVITHKTGNVVKVYSVGFGATTGAPAALDFGVVETNGVHTQISGSGGTISLAISSAGDIDSISFTPGTTPNIAVTQGQAIWVHTDGGSTNDVDAAITIVIE